jgi:hypothetical protein
LQLSECKFNTKINTRKFFYRKKGNFFMLILD